MMHIKKIILILAAILIVSASVLLTGCSQANGSIVTATKDRSSTSFTGKKEPGKKEAASITSDTNTGKNTDTKAKTNNNITSTTGTESAVTSQASATEVNISVLPGRPTDSSIAFNILTQNNSELSISYGMVQDKPDKEKSGILVKAGNSLEVDLSSLEPDSQYYYSIQNKPENENGLKLFSYGKFHTARPEGSSFTFAVEADPHLDEQTDPGIYRQSLENILNDSPDFLIDLGDTFMTDKLPEKSEKNILDRYLLFRDFFNITGGSVPLFFTPGNHDGEAGWDFSSNADKLALFSSTDRLKYFPNPFPDGFYSGNTQKADGQFIEDYFAFNWGDGLFISLDPYRYTEKKPGGNGWEWTLGKEQYDWLKNTLAGSTAKYKFVFIHQLVGGGTEGRGGVEFAGLYEWGGNSPDGSYGFDENRPDWGKPIHQLLVDNNVDVVFKGHDHFFAKQELDGIIYQTLPQPGHAGDKINTAEEYGYLSGDIIGGSGYLRVTVSGAKTTVEFMEAGIEKKSVYSYDIN